MLILNILLSNLIVVEHILFGYKPLILMDVIVYILLMSLFMIFLNPLSLLLRYVKEIAPQ